MNIDPCNVRKINVPLSREIREVRRGYETATTTTIITIERYVKVTRARGNQHHDASSKGACEVEGEG